MVSSRCFFFFLEPMAFVVLFKSKLVLLSRRIAFLELEDIYQNKRHFKKMHFQNAVFSS